MNQAEREFLDDLVAEKVNLNPNLRSEQLLRFIIAEQDTDPAALLTWTTAHPQTRPLIDEFLRAGHGMVDAMQNAQLWLRFMYAETRRIEHAGTAPATQQPAAVVDVENPTKILIQRRDLEHLLQDYEHTERGRLAAMRVRALLAHDEVQNP